MTPRKCVCGPAPDTAPTHSVEASPEIAGYVTVTCDGVDVTREVAALRAGTGGWVCLFRRDDTGCRYACPRGHVAVEYRHGDVTIVMTDAAALPVGDLTHFAALGIGSGLEDV